MPREDFAEKTGVSKTTIERIESGKNFEIISLLKIAQAFGICPYELCMNEEDRKMVEERIQSAREGFKREIIDEVLRELLSDKRQRHKSGFEG